MSSARLIGLLTIFITSVFWGLSFVSLKITIAVIPPMTLALLRFLIACVVLFLVLKRVEPDSRLLKQDIPLMALSGMLGVTAYYYFQNNGVTLTTASAASMILAVIPILTILGDFLIFKAKLSLVKCLSVLLSVGGVYIIVASPEQQSSQGLLGNILMLGAALSWVGYTMMTKPLTTRYSGLAVVTYQTLFGTLFLVPFVFFESFSWQVIDVGILLHLLYLGVICSALANYFYVSAMDVLGISSVSLFINLIPVVSVLGGVVVLHEAVSGLQMLGGCVIVLAVFISNCNIGRQQDAVARDTVINSTTAQECEAECIHNDL